MYTATANLQTCSTPADPTGASDSTCAFWAATDYAYQGSFSGPDSYTTLYVPRGTYKISQPWIVSCNVVIRGDGPYASTIEQTTNTANGIDVMNTQVFPSATEGFPLASCEGGLRDIGVTTQGGPMHSGTLLQVIGAGYELENVNLYNSGGYGLNAVSGTERMRAYNLQISDVRYSLFGPGNEGHFYKLNIDNPETSTTNTNGTSDGWGSNCANGTSATNYMGACINWDWTGTMTLNAASSDGTNGYYQVSCAPAAQCILGNGSTSPVYPGNWFNAEGSSITGLNGTFQALAVLNGCSQASGTTCTTTSSTSFVVVTTNTSTGSNTLTSPTWKPAFVPETHPGVALTGFNVEVNGGSIKAVRNSSCVTVFNAQVVTVQNVYCENAPVNGQPGLGPSIVVNGVVPYTLLTSGLPGSNSCTAGDNCSATVAGGTANGSQWMGNVEDSPVFENAAGSFYIYPPDYNPSSSSPSIVPGVNQNQREEVIGSFAGNTFYVQQRFGIGGVYPAWTSGSYLQWLITNTFGPELTTEANHFETINPGNSSYFTYCNDSEGNSSVHQCGMDIMGALPDGVLVFPVGIAGAFSQGATSLMSINDELIPSTGSAAEILGEGWIKCNQGCNVVASSADNIQQNGETSNVSTGLVSNGGVYPLVAAVKYSNGVYSTLSYSNPSYGAGYSYNGASNSYFFENQLYKPYGASSTTLLGSGPFGSFPYGHQFANADCWYDVGPSQGHAQYRMCDEGGPFYTPSGTKGGWEFDIWNGTSWVSAFSVRDTGSNTANLTVSGTLTVNGVQITAPLKGTSAAWNNSGTGIAANTCVDGPTAAITGLTTSMFVGVSPAASPGAGLQWSAYASVAGTATGRVCNVTSASVTPSSTTYNFRVLQ
nr:glycoside hydrolase family 55 protein [Paracidobacterium acidisoli]